MGSPEVRPPKKHAFSVMEGEVLPSRKTTVNGEWRIASGFERQCSCTAEKFLAHQKMCPPVFQPASTDFAL